MPFGSVLVHLNTEPRVARLIGAALQLALPSGAHVTGLFVVPHLPRSPLAIPAVTGPIAQSALDAYRRAGERVREAFETAARGLPCVAEWRYEEPDHPGYVEAVLEHARAADIVVAAQKDSDWDYADMFDVPDSLVLESGRPVLVVPVAAASGPIGHRVVVAWNNSREAARAAFDALPILERAHEVLVLSVEEASKPQTTGEQASTEILAALARHGVRCHGAYIQPTEGEEPAELILSHAEREGYDLLVMGCYGRSRFREFILGGASRHVLKHARLPVLMSH